MEFKRKNIRLQRACYIGRRWYFLTACTQDRIPWLRDAPLVDEQLGLLTDTARQEVFDLQAYCFMPDHLHLLVNGTRGTSDCLAFTHRFKQRSAHAFKQRTGRRLWQHKSYDHVLRQRERWQAAAYYMWMNPVRKGLCDRPEQWPFSGSQTMDWRQLLTPPCEFWVPPWK